MACAVVVLVLADHARAAVIGFDAVDASGGPVSVTDEYRDEGVLFEGLFVRNVAGQVYYTSGPGAGRTSFPNVGVINDESPFSLLVTARFVVPGTAIPGVMQGTARAVFFDSEIGSLLVRMTAYDLLGEILDSKEVLTTAANYAYVEVSGWNISRVTLEADVDGTTFDQFSFDRVVPEPTSGLLMLAGMCVLARRRR